jgi:hypothetical protein
LQLFKVSILIHSRGDLASEPPLSTYFTDVGFLIPQLSTSYDFIMSAMKKLIVCGGNGFLGSRICKYAVARGWDVTSIRFVAP